MNGQKETEAPTVIRCGFQRVALLNVRIESRQRSPVGLLTLAAVVKDAATTIIFDPDPDDRTLDDVVAFQPDLIGIGFMTQTRFRALEINAILRRKLPGAKIILGGVGPTVEPDKTFELFQPDALVVGEGEKALMAIVRTGQFEGIPGVYLPGLPFQPGEVFWDLDELPLPAIECMPDFYRYLCPPGGIRGKWFKSGTPMIMTSRGCPYRCTFCSSHLMFSRKVRRRSVGHVLAEIRRLHGEFGVDAVYFFDDTFNVQRHWLEAFCAALEREPYKLTWGCQIRVNLFDVEMGRMMRKAGCVQVDIGVESGSPKVLKAIHKDETVEQIEKAFAACHAAGLAPMGTFLVGCPDETWEDVELTKGLLRRIKPSFAEFFYLIPFPGSDLYNQAVANHWIVDDSYEGRGMVDRPVLKINFTLEEQIRIRREYFKMMAFRNLSGYFSPSVLWNVLTSVRPCMVAAFAREFRKTRNLRDAMQAYVHALRNYHAAIAGKRQNKRTVDRGRVALLFRYGLKAHAELHQIIPECLEKVAERHDVLYAGPRCGDMRIPGVTLRQLPYQVDRSNPRDVFWKTLWWYVCLPYLSLQCRFWKADLIWIDESLPLFGWIVQFFSGRPTMLTVVDFFLEVYGEKHPWLRPFAAGSYFLERRSWNKSLAIVTRTTSMKHYLSEHGVDPAVIHMIRDTFSTRVFAPKRAEELRARLGFSPQDIVVVHHGILHPNKGIGRILSWLAPEMKSNKHLKFLVVGDGVERVELEQRVRADELESAVVFTGWLPSSRAVAEYLNAGDIGLVMRTGQVTDHFHVTGTLVHCLLCGLPVLAARLSGICEIVTDGKEGILFDPASRDEFVQGVAALCADAERRAQMGTNGRKKALTEFNPQIVLDQTVELIRCCVENPGC